MLKFIKRQINSVKRDGLNVLIRKIKNLPLFLNAINWQRYDSLWLWSSARQLSECFGFEWSFLYFREARIIYAKLFSKYVKNGDLRSMDLAANQMTRLIHKGLAYEPDNYEYYYLLADVMLYVGQVDEWAKYAKTAFERREHKLNQVLPAKQGLRLFDTSCVRSIGLACHWDGMLKARHLGLIPPDKFVMIWSNGAPSANPHWMSYLGQYVVLLDERNNEHKKVIGSFRGIERDAGERFHEPLRIGNRVFAYTHSGLALIEQHWGRESREPFFKLTPEDIDYGRHQLSSVGVPKNAWFVCLHVREGGFKGNEFFREAPIQDYLMAIQAVTKRGGWVIRVGDPTMTPLPKMDNVIDYPHSDTYSDRMDIVLCGLCRFFIATSSGLYTVAKAFGKPIVQTNYLPTCTLFLSKQDVFLPKLARRTKDHALLNLSEIMSLPFSFGVNDINYKQLGVELINNSPEEIAEVVEEMIDKLDGKFIVDATDEELQAQFKDMTARVETLYGLDNVPINCQIGTHFLRSYQYLLPLQLKEN